MDRTLLLLSSFPLHLLFNSAVFETRYEGRNWNLTIATEAFAAGSSFFAPGASLAPNTGDPSDMVGNSGEIVQRLNSLPNRGYGSAPTSPSDYSDPSSKTLQALNATAQQAATKWTRLKPSDCLKEYRSCNPRKTFGDVVIVVEGPPDNSDGWIRSEVFQFKPQSQIENVWDTLVPPNKSNSLWLFTNCETTRSSESLSHDICHHDCLSALGKSDSQYMDVNTEFPSGNWTIPFFDLPYDGYEWYDEMSYVFNETLNNLKVDYCLAQPIDHLCRIGVSNSILLTVTICFMVKLFSCAVVVWKLPMISLVTPGDAIESFISFPDKITEGLGTLEIEDSQRLEFGPRQLWSSEIDPDLTPAIRPRRWNSKPRRLAAMIPRAAWVRTYSFLIFGVVVAIVGFLFSIAFGKDKL